MSERDRTHRLDQGYLGPIKTRKEILREDLVNENILHEYCQSENYEKLKLTE